ncbi:MAG: hypothetical protein J07HX64_01550 [halophilic archaeon J07HX64]|nr:MAG: hypothetical protein J07HX64_01550 [halophilic archaeon J07HX64]
MVTSAEQFRYRGADIEHTSNRIDDTGVRCGDHRLLGVQAVLETVVAHEHQFVPLPEVVPEFADETVEFGVGPLLQFGAVVADVPDEVEPARVAEDEFVASAPERPADPCSPDHRHLHALLVERLGVGRLVTPRGVGVALEQLTHLPAQLVFPVLGVLDDVVRYPDRPPVLPVEQCRQPALLVVTRRHPERVLVGVVQQPGTEPGLDGVGQHRVRHRAPGPEKRVLPGHPVVEL